MTLEQEGFRWRADNGPEEGSPGASYLAAQDSNISIGVDTAVRLRMLVNHTGGAAPGASNYRLEYRKIDSPTPQWSEVAPAGSPIGSSDRIQMVASPYITAGGEETTAQLAAPAGSPKSFTAGRIWDDESGQDSITVGADQYTELEFCIRAVSANGAAASDVYEFRVSRKSAAEEVGGGGETLVHGPDTFTGANGTALSSHNANWTSHGGQILEIQDNSAKSVISGVSTARWAAGTLTDSRIEADLFTGATAPENVFPGLMVRTDIEGNGYLAEWDTGTGDIILYRVTGQVDNSGGSFTVIAQGGAVVGNTTYTGAYFKVTGASPVQLELGDDINGAAIVTFSDSDGARHQTGQPGLSLYNGTGEDGNIDNVSIYSIP